jgi:hemoglobin
MAAVDRFYQKVLADELTRPFFAGLDMEAQTRKQIAFMSWAFGGPERYNARGLRQAHAKLVHDRGLGDEHFDAVARHLKATLEELGVAPALVQEALSIVAGTRQDVLCR